MNEKLRPQPPLFLKYLFWSVILLIFVPLVYLFISAYWDQGFTGKWLLEAFQDENLLLSVWRSFWIATTSALFTTLLSSLSAIGVYVFTSKLDQYFQGLTISTLVMPEIVFALSLLSWFVLIKFELSLFTVWLSHVAFGLAFSFFTISGRLSQINPTFYEAARDLGANNFILITKIILPILKPALVSSLALAFLLSFDDFLITYFVNGFGTDTFTVVLYSNMKFGLTPKLSAMSSLVFLGSLLLARPLLKNT